MTHPSTRVLARATAGTLAAALAAAGLVGLGATATFAAPPVTGSRTALPSDDTRDAPPEVTARKSVSLTKQQQRAFREAASGVGTQRRAQASAPAAATGTPIGGEKTWLLYDEKAPGRVDATPYVLRAVGENIEVWVQKDLDFPSGDCRNDGIRNVVTDAQVKGLVTEFDTNMYPKESKTFSTAPARNGTEQVDAGFGAPLWQVIGGEDPNYFKGDGHKTVTLVSNVRDTNFYDPTSPDGRTFTAGFFSPVYNEGFDRNVMTLDSYDWVHRSGAHPRDDADVLSLCSTAQPARPRDYEATFAHEYQHQLEYYQDDAEKRWLNEGLSDYAQTLVGYVDTRLRYGQTGADEHLTCFQGFYGSGSFPYCGAENSLTRWEDQGGPSILADFGAAYSFATYLSDQFGPRVITYLHRDSKAQGLASLQNYLDDYAPGLTATDVIHDWAAQMALDRFVDDGAKGLSRDRRDRFTSAKLSSAIDWAWTGSYDSPGAPANGSDYVLARRDRPVNARTITSMSFRGAKTYRPDPLEWIVADGALYAGTGGNVDRSAIYSVAVPTKSPNLTFATRYNIEKGWDFGVVQVSTDGGKTYQSLSNPDTTSTHASGAVGNIVANLPGLTGVSAAFKTERFDLSAYAGKKVLLSFRYLTDPAVNGTDQTMPSGWWVKDVRLGTTVVTSGATLAGARSATEVRPVRVPGWEVQAVGWKLNGSRVRYAEIRLSKNHRASLSKKKARRLFKGADRIGFIVTVDDPQEVATKNANYRLRVNGRTQPGGRGNTNPTTAGSTLAKRLPVSRRSNVG